MMPGLSPFRVVAHLAGFCAPSTVGLKHYQFWISPLDIHFTHDRISDAFRPPFGNIFDTSRELEQAKDSLPKELECIDVVWKEEYERWFAAGTFHSRLCMFRLLAIFTPDDVLRVQARRVPPGSVHWHLKDGTNKFSTQCQGDSGDVKGGWFVGKTESSVKWLAARESFKTLKAEQS